MFRNTIPLGDEIVLGNPHNRLITIACSERSLTLAFKHVVQQTGDYSHGFLLGSSEFAEGKS